MNIHEIAVKWQTSSHHRYAEARIAYGHSADLAAGYQRQGAFSSNYVRHILGVCEPATGEPQPSLTDIQSSE